MQLEGVDLVLAVGAGLDGAGGADFVAWIGQRMRAQALAHVYGGQAGEGDALGIADDEVGVAVAIGVHALHIDDPAHGFAAGGVAGGAMRGRGPGSGAGEQRGYKGR